MDITLNYIQKGNPSSPTLVLLHGNGENAQCFHSQLDFFSKDFNVFAIDTRGHGRSPRGNAPFTIETFARDLKNFADQKGLSRFSLLGFSVGGNIALTFALNHPGYIQKLILNGTNLNPRGVKSSVQKPVEIGFAAARFFSHFSKKAAKNAEMLGLMVTQPNISPKLLSAIKAPTLVIVGSDDMIKHQHSMVIAQSIEGAQLAVIPGDHFVAYKKPEQFNKAVNDFLMNPSHNRI